MSFEILSTSFEIDRTPDPGMPYVFNPQGVDVGQIATAADVSYWPALDMVNAVWAQVETFTGRTYRPMATGEVIVRAWGSGLFRWPRFPEPEAMTVETLAGTAWVPQAAAYVPGVGVELAPGVYRLRQVGMVPGCPVAPHVAQAVVHLALYQFVHMPHRREFRSQGAGDTSMTRESLMGLFYGSGAGALLAPAASRHGPVAAPHGGIGIHGARRHGLRREGPSPHAGQHGPRGPRTGHQRASFGGHVGRGHVQGRSWLPDRR